MKRTYQRGEMYYADLGRGVGSEQEGRRPVVIIQNDVGNKHSPTVIVAAITPKQKRSAVLTDSLQRTLHLSDSFASWK